MFAVVSFASNGFSTFTPGANTILWAIGLSPNGQYMSCWLGSGLGSALVDTKTNTYYYYDGGSEFCAVTNDGMMIGWGENGVFGYNPVTGEQLVSDKEVLGKGATTDGSIIVGSIVVNGWSQQAGYYKDGEVNFLPQPSEEDVGFDPGQGTVALDISDDGSVICGYLIDWYAGQAGLLWKLGDDGNYVLDPICKGMHEGEFSGDAPYFYDSPTAMSHNGKYIAFDFTDNDGTMSGGTPYVGRYNMETGEMETSSLKFSCSATRIADDGTMLVHTGDASSQSRNALLWTTDAENPEYMSDIYPEVKEFALYDRDDWNYGTCISSDARYICGMAWHYMEGEGEDYARQISWLFDRQAYTTGIHEATSDVVFDSDEAEYYSLDGKKLSAPQKGLNIIRQGDKVSKVIVR